MVCPAGIEPAAYCLGGSRSIQLSYEHMRLLIYSDVVTKSQPLITKLYRTREYRLKVILFFKERGELERGKTRFFQKNVVFPSRKIYYALPTEPKSSNFARAIGFIAFLA